MGIKTRCMMFTIQQKIKKGNMRVAFLIFNFKILLLLHCLKMYYLVKGPHYEGQYYDTAAATAAAPAATAALS